MDRKITGQQRPWWRRPLALGGIALALVALFVWRWMPESGSTNIVAANLDIGQVERAPFADYLPVRATVEPRLTTLVGISISGQVERLLVQDGAMVIAGQPLATLSNPSLRRDVLAQEAQIAGQLSSISNETLAIERSRMDRTAQIELANYDLLRAQRELGIRQQLHDKGILADAALKNYTDEVAYQKQRLAQLRSGSATEGKITAEQQTRLGDARALLQGNLAAVRSGLDALTIRAPAAGRLTNFDVQPGQALNPGDPAGQVDSEGSWKLVADVDEYYLSRVKVGQEASADKAKLHIAKVLPTVKNGRFRIELTFDGAPPDGLNRGQTVDVRVTLGSTAPALVAPVGGWLDDSGGSSAFVLDSDGNHARRHPVSTGRRNPQRVEILSGLSPGDRIITSNTAAVKGDVINIK
ncbi:efflux RND transporter periplasmic adaptor subunit [Sphingomonadaceae bacterium LXI357]|uniref:Efflux RND transporter periplasmic adaptor subunit n=2 Tax=Stakelama marina TaxID=2826939 RepID=A0A8T4IG11_9SPHN|nr:efflux RND transporter periplasmic adaptor subunit [Stakelama marina]